MAMSRRLNFELLKQAKGSRARLTRFRTLHNEVLTPIFMPVGTFATVRTQPLDIVNEIGAQVLLANTFHLMLRPGPELFQKFGDIHRFMRWPKSVLTDSGGFQIFCLPEARQMTEEGARFRAYTDKRQILLTPERSIEMQKTIGSDIMMVLDECIPSTSTHEVARAAMERTHRWAARSLAARGDSPQSMFGIVQGACYEDLRRESARVLTQMPFDGFAIGGLAVGETSAEREDSTEIVTELLPHDLPRYLMGVGTPRDLLEAVHRGVDMFDCILPTALAQQGVVFTWNGKIDLRRGRYRLEDSSLDPACECTVCRNYSIAYLHHLQKVKEPLAWQLLATHNLTFYMKLMAGMRQAIAEDRFLEFYHAHRENLGRSDGLDPPKRKPAHKKSKPAPMQLGRFEIVQQGDIAGIRDTQSGEIMHSVNDPHEEARRLYIDQSGLMDILRQTDTSTDPVVVWDVGLGAAFNAMALVGAYEDAAARGEKLRPLHICSFEIDTDPLKLVIGQPWLFSHARHAGPHRINTENLWQSKKMSLRWELFRGDFLETMDQAPPPRVIFHDPFSTKVDGPLWHHECFQRIRKAASGEDCLLLTYSRSTAVRSALLGAGFFVGQGLPSGPKPETTVAATRARDLQRCGRPLLGPEWLKRWERSQARFPGDIEAATHEKKSEFEGLIRNHPQLYDRPELS
jgi:queuine tRNA-ribosyltransferase